MMAVLRSQKAATGLPLVTIADLAVSNVRLTVDGDDSTGYKIIIESPGAAAQEVYVVRVGTTYKVAAFAASGSNIEELAPLALYAIENNNLAAAKKWLDRARDKIHVTGGDDPLSGQPFPTSGPKDRTQIYPPYAQQPSCCSDRKHSREHMSRHWTRLAKPLKRSWIAID